MDNKFTKTIVRQTQMNKTKNVKSKNLKYIIQH